MFNRLFGNGRPEATKAENALEAEKKHKEDAERLFAARMQQILQEVKDLEKQVEKGEVETYGQFTKTTSKNIKLILDTLKWKSSETSGEWLLITATDDVTKKIIGVRTTRITRVNPNETSAGAGSIIVHHSERDKGISTVIEKTLIELLQDVVNKQSITNKNSRLNWGVTNANLKKLPNKNDQVEQQRWQKVYGEKGKFGFKQTSPTSGIYEKTIVPNEDGPKEIHQINLEQYKKIVDDLKTATLL